jgi:hypothetical protein
MTVVFVAGVAATPSLMRAIISEGESLKIEEITGRVREVPWGSVRSVQRPWLGLPTWLRVLVLSDGSRIRFDGRLKGVPALLDTIEQRATNLDVSYAREALEQVSGGWWSKLVTLALLLALLVVRLGCQH